MRNNIANASLLALSISMSSVSFAQEDVGDSHQADAQSGLEAIVVTAQKREESAQRVGISISSLGSSTLRSMNVTTAVDITARIPSLQSSQVSQSVVNYAIRGVSQNDYADHLEPPVAMYIDDAYLAILATGSLPVFDIQRVEVLRGPQGTLFGRNATGGAMRFVTNPPTKEFEGYVNITAGNYNLTRVEAAGGGPITDNLQLRVASDFSNVKGYIANPPFEQQGTSGGKALGAVNYRAVRATLAWQPTGDVDVTLQGRYTKNYDGTGSPYIYRPTVADEHGMGRYVLPDENPYGTGLGCGPAPAECYSSTGRFSSPSNTSGYYDSLWYGGTLKVDWALGDLVLTSVTDAQHFEKDFYEDTDGSPFNILDDRHKADLNQFSQEVRGVYSSGPLVVTAGLNYLQFKTKALTEYILDTYRTHNYNIVDNKSYAGFVQVEYDVSPTITIIGGARYTHDKKWAEYYLSDNAGTTPVVFTPETQPDLAKRSYNMISAKAMVQWQPTRDLMFYASYNRGTKSGGFEFSGFLPVDLSSINYGNETLHAFEVGEKLTFLNGRGRWNTSLFYYDYQNYQAYFFVPIPGGFTQTIANRDARVYGLESELTLDPLEGLTANLGISLLRTKVFDVRLPDGTVTDRHLPQAPKFSANALLRYEAPLGNTGLLVSEQFEGVYKSAYGLSVLAGETESQGRYFVGNAQIGLSPESRKWKISLYVKNLFDKKYKTFGFDLNSLGFVAESFARPRNYGLSVNYEF